MYTYLHTCISYFKVVEEASQPLLRGWLLDERIFYRIHGDHNARRDRVGQDVGCFVSFAGSVVPHQQKHTTGFFDKSGSFLRVSLK